MNIFELDSVSYAYESVPAIDGVSLKIAPGTRIGLLGANGSGKSTLLRLLDALDFPQSGTIRFRDRLLHPTQFEKNDFAFDFRRRVGLVFQNPDVQLFNATVFDEIAFAPLQLQWPDEEVRRRVAETLETMQIADLRDRPPHRLSGGEKKRVALASVLVLDPEVLLLDEPTAALDPRSQSQIIDLLVGWGNGNKTVITATHDLGLVEDIADYCYVLDRGRIAGQGTPAEVLADQDFLARMNLLHAHRHRHGSDLTHSHPHSHPHTHPHRH